MIIKLACIHILKEVGAGPRVQASIISVHTTEECMYPICIQQVSQETHKVDYSGNCTTSQK